MSKQVKKEVKNPKNKNFYLTIVRHIQQTSMLPDMGITKENRNYYIKPLKIEGIIKNIGYKTWEVNEDKLHLLEEVKEVKTSRRVLPTHLNTPKEQRIRGHGFQFKLILPTINNWKRRRTYLDKVKIKFKLLNGGESITFEERKIHIYDKSIVIYPIRGESYFAESARTSKKHAFYTMTRFCNRLRGFLSADIRKGNKYQLVLSKQHQSEIHNEISKQYDKEGKKLFVYDNGKCFAMIDNSHHFHEFECIDGDRADSDMDDKIRPRLVDWRNKESYLDSDSTQWIRSIAEKLDKVTEQNKETSRYVFHNAAGLKGLLNFIESQVYKEPPKEDKSKKLTDYIG